MTIHHQAHRDRIDAGIGFEWDRLPAAVGTAAAISPDAGDVNFRRTARSYRGIAAHQNIRRLWAYSVDQGFLEEISALASLEVLYLNAVTAKDLSALGRLARLRSLSVIGATKVPDLEWTAPLHALDALALEHFKLVRDLSPLAGLTRLRALAIEGSMWARMKVATLEPLSHLENLNYLFLTNLQAEDRSLRPLAALKKLKVLECAAFYPKEEFELLAQANGALRCSWFMEKNWKK
ncbi:MAG: hypothetical protein ACO1NO_00505 [Burkholderiaceae bacterium]